MSRRYTAQEMRETADNVCADFTFARVNVGSDARPVYMEIKPHEVASMLRQAADDMEREEKRERKYEFSVYPPEVNGVFQYRAGAELKACILNLAGYRDGTIVRREVGEWEEVRSEEV